MDTHRIGSGRYRQVVVGEEDLKFESIKVVKAYSNDKDSVNMPSARKDKEEKIVFKDLDSVRSKDLYNMSSSMFFPNSPKYDDPATSYQTKPEKKLAQDIAEVIGQY